MDQSTRNSLIEALLQGSGSDPMTIESVIKETCYKIDQMPFLLKKALTVLRLLFQCHAWIKGKRPFSLQTLDQRLLQINAWRSSPIQACREFVLLHEKLTFFIFFSRQHP